MQKKEWNKPEMEVLDVSLTMKGIPGGHQGGGGDDCSDPSDLGS